MFNTNNIVQGDELAVFDKDGSLIGFATSFTFSSTLNTQEIASKDSGYFTAMVGTKIGWEIQCECLYSEYNIDKLNDIFDERKAIILMWGHSDLTDEQRKYGTNEITYYDSSKLRCVGKAYLTSLSVTASSGDVATCSVTFTGNGTYYTRTGDTPTTTTIPTTTIPTTTIPTTSPTPTPTNGD